jgi:hypothetical protein
MMDFGTGKGVKVGAGGLSGLMLLQAMKKLRKPTANENFKEFFKIIGLRYGI